MSELSKNRVCCTMRYVVDINGKKKLTVRPGNSLFKELRNTQIFVPSACGGRGACGLCKVQVKQGGGPLTDAEVSLLTQTQKRSNFRLSCQVTVSNDLQVVVPEHWLAGREYTCECTGIIDLTHNIRQLSLKVARGETIEYQAGQYIWLRVPRYELSTEDVYRAYSIAGDPTDKGSIELLVKFIPGGIAGTYCFKYLEVGAEIGIYAPYGDFRLSSADSPIVFIAGGSGMAPIKSMLHYMANIRCQRKAVYFFGANTVEELFLVEQMRKFEKKLPGFKFIPVVADPEPEAHWNGETGLVTEAVERNLKNAQEYEGYICGAPGMVEAAIRVLTKLRIPENRIFYDKFT